MKAIEIILLSLILVILAALLVPTMLTPPDPDDDGLLEFDLESIGIYDEPPLEHCSLEPRISNLK